MDEMLMHTMIAACAMALLTGLVGPLVVWRRMAYVGDTMGHSALLGVVLGMIAGLGAMPSILIFAVLSGLVLSILGRDARLPFDALLVMVSTGALALGLLLFANQPSSGDVMGYLMGDILAVSEAEVKAVFAIAAVVAFILWCNWNALIRMMLHEDMAKVEGVPTGKISALLLVLVAVAVAVAVQVVGILLVTAMLVVPPLTARSVASNPSAMLLGSVVVGMVASVIGVWVAFEYNQPVGPCMVLASLVLFGASRLVPAR